MLDFVAQSRVNKCNATISQFIRDLFDHDGIDESFRVVAKTPWTGHKSTYGLSNYDQKIVRAHMMTLKSPLLWDADTRSWYVTTGTVEEALTLWDPQALTANQYAELYAQIKGERK